MTINTNKTKRFSRQKKKKRQLIIFTGFLLLGSSAIITIPAILSTKLVASDPLFQVKKNIKLISAVNLKDEFVNSDSNYFIVKNKIFNNDGSKKSGVDLTSFFDFYQSLPNYSGVIDFKNDTLWSKFKIEIFEIKPIDSEQSFDVYYRLLQDLGNNKIAKSDLYHTKVAYSFNSNYSLTNFANQAKAELSKLRPWTNQEFSRSTKKRLTKLTLVDDFFAEINQAKTATELEKILDQFFNYSEIINNLYKKAENQFENELGKLVPKIQVQLIQDPMFHQGFLTKTATENIYRLWFNVSFAPEFAKTIKQDFNSDAKFQSYADLDFSDFFLNEKIKDEINLTPFSQQDYLNLSAENQGKARDAWDFINYFKNQVFATKDEKKKFLNDLLKKITKKSLIEKLNFGKSFDNLPKEQIFESLQFNFEIDPDKVELVNQKNEVQLRVFGKVKISDASKNFSISKDFHQDYGNLGLISQNDPKISEKIKATNFEFNPISSQSSYHNSKKLSKNEILELLQNENHKKLRKILTNKRYYGVEFDETRLKFLVTNYQLPSIEKLKSVTTDDYNFSQTEGEEGIINVFNSIAGKTEQTLRFLVALASKDVQFVGKYWFDFLQYLKLIKTETKWPSDFDSHNFFKKMSEIKIEDTRDKEPPSSRKKDLWLFSFNGNYWADKKGRLPYSFFLHENFKNLRNFIKTDDKSANVDYFIEQIRETARKIPENEAKQEKSIKFENFADFLMAFYATVYSNDKGLLANSLGENFGYQIKFNEKIEPKNVQVSTISDTQNKKIKLEYLYKIGPVDQNNNLISTLFKTNKGELEIEVDDSAQKYDDELEDLNDLAQHLPATNFPVYFKKEDYDKFSKKVQEEVKKDSPNIEKILKNFTFWEFFKLNYPNYGLKIVKDVNSNTSTDDNADIKDVFENISSISGETKKALYLGVFSKKNPQKVSDSKVKIIIKQAETSAFNI
ncbi:Uncharacterised protein [Mesomycoplasma dispar]|uniref:Uncharacterized protein n=1 Tax=Mesomycoplasma dispar TaxID=86660 RepID=A0AAJ5TCL6_9BACT|nr:hypothetical protein [Mesomycoplasma dispar]VEU61852.1 Uncharacterised protein [Mesomycoplasma dispar]